MKKILVIEDEQQSREIFIECLEAEGFNAIGAANGIIGVQQAQEHVPDLVICDIIMPELDGYGVLAKLQQDLHTAAIPFIFLTIKGTKGEQRKGMKLGADDYITKPFTVDELLMAIATRLEKQALLKQWYTLLSQRVAAPLPVCDKIDSTGQDWIFPSCPQLNPVFEFIETNYHRSISLSDVAKAVGYTSGYLTDLMRRRTGQTVNRWIIERRLVGACYLLLETDQSLEQIAEAVGYQNLGHFFRQFRKYRETTPQLWRKVHHNQSSSK